MTGRPSRIIKPVQEILSHFVLREHLASIRRPKREQAQRCFGNTLQTWRLHRPCMQKLSLFEIKNVRQQLLFLTLSFEEQNIQRQMKQGPAQLATDTHDHEKSRERQAYYLSCLYFASFSCQSKMAQDKSRQSFCLHTWQGKSMFTP